MTNLIRFGIRNQQVLKRAVLGHPILRLGYRLKHLLRANTRKGSRRNISAHYDLGNDFYRLWLDPSMTYSSAVFDGDNSRSLESAQREKYQQVLANSGAQKGDIVLEIGCGWGGFAEHAASAGVNVHGITLSREQLAFADNRMQKAGLDQSVELELRDYRDLTGEYDHIVSIEMLEAVGEEYWPVYFVKLKQLLRPKGRAVIQVITIDDDYFDEYRKRTDFIQQHIFPGGLLPSVARLQSLSADHQLKVLKVKPFGKDYAETIRRWQQKFEATTQTILDQGFDDSFLRLWRCYFNYCEAGFDEGRINVVHLVLENG